MQRWTWTSVLLVGLASIGVGCNGSNTEYKAAKDIKAEPEEHHDHGHGAEGPHHGALVELGEHEYHAEIVIDEVAHVIRVYLLGPDAKTAATSAATEASIAVEGGHSLTLKPAVDQPEGKISVWEVADEDTVHKLLEDGHLHGTLHLQVGDKKYTPAIDAHFHGDHDHHHDEKAAPKLPEPTDTEGALPTTTTNEAPASAPQ